MLSLDSFRGDLRQTLRSLLREKSFTATVLITFTLCLAANVVIFAVLRAVLIDPLPFKTGGPLVVTYNSYVNMGITRSASSVPNYYERRGTIDAFAETAAYVPTSFLVGEKEAINRVFAFSVTPSFFRVLNVQPALGRAFLDEEGEPGHARVILLSDAYWRQHFNSDPSIVGKTIIIDSTEMTILGVMKPGLRFLSSEPKLWRPMPFSKEARALVMRQNNSIEIIAQLKAGFTIPQAQQQIDALNQRWVKDDPNADWARGAGFRTTVTGLREEHVAHVRPALLLLQAGVLLLLLIGVVNVINLYVVRATSRSKELAVRQVLGASRLNLALQFLGETVMVSGLGGVLGLTVGTFAVHLLKQQGTDQLPLGANISVGWPVSVACLAGSLFLGVVLAIPVILFSTQSNLAPALTAESRSGTTSRATHRFRHGLIVGQIALAFILVTGAGLLAVSFKKILAIQPGFRPDGVVTAWVTLPGKTYPAGIKRLSFSDRWLEAIQKIPGVESAGLGTTLPVVGEFGNLSMLIDGSPPAPGEAAHTHHLAAIKGDYLRALGVILREGRFLNADDSQGDTRVCVVDEYFAYRYWPNGGALGHGVSIGNADAGNNAMMIVGVVGGVKQNSLTEKEAMGMLYYPFRVDNAPGSSVAVVRASQNPSSLVPAMRHALRQIDPGLPLDDVKTMNTRVDETLLLPHAMMLLAIIFAAMALLLAALGVYGVLAYAVSQRQREIGIRLALGAVSRQIIQQFIWLGARILLVGALLGLAGSWFVGRAMDALLFQVSPMNGPIVLVSLAVLSVIVLLASWFSSRRAAYVPLIEALRND